MPLVVGLATLLAVAPVQTGSAMQAGAALCGEAMSIYLPEPLGTPAPNIQLAHFQYMSPDEACARNVQRDVLMRLHDRIKPIAASAFANSKASFSVMVRYTLTPDKPAVFEMQTTTTPATEEGRLTAFYHGAAALDDARSTLGTVYVVFNYDISPARR
ncbi:hypothetical protein FHR56_001733 [Xanthomonas sacchari]|uniref:hypothetical protein n=1 Tax=unclassified Xanthomonas TaxID=2643310 RepID=UPI0013690402|nr:MULTISPECIES: hypothetical protein [unclassified Xanthomonas]MBB6366620.1 hypothetical protein [Xanthomonas sp. F10]MXV33370.1 hypothetical protein [Xanthomonas sp. LMG 8989]